MKHIKGDIYQIELEDLYEDAIPALNDLLDLGRPTIELTQDHTYKATSEFDAALKDVEFNCKRYTWDRCLIGTTMTLTYKGKNIDIQDFIDEDVLYKIEERQLHKHFYHLDDDFEFDI
jgi:hypothetical protein